MADRCNFRVTCEGAPATGGITYTFPSGLTVDAGVACIECASVVARHEGYATATARPVALPPSAGSVLDDMDPVARAAWMCAVLGAIGLSVTEEESGRLVEKLRMEHLWSRAGLWLKGQEIRFWPPGARNAAAHAAPPLLPTYGGPPCGEHIAAMKEWLGTDEGTAYATDLAGARRWGRA